MPKSHRSVDKLNKGKRKVAGPETADEYLAAGVELEEAGEKWRGGDQQKSMRFFIRAIEMYETGLEKYPESFDLAYNKARVQYEITQHPKLVKQLSAPLTDALEVALGSHREALKLQQENEDALFNTAQVLTSLAEATSDAQKELEMLQEALELFQRCLAVQEFRYTDSQEMQLSESGEASEPEETMNIGSPGRSLETEHWATIVEPVTKETLIDTAVAQLQTLAALCSLLTSDPGSGLAWVEEYWTSVQQKIDVYLEGTDRQNEVALARATFIAALADISFRTGRLDAETYRNEVTNAFAGLESQEARIALAEAKMSINLAMSEMSFQDEALKKSNVLRWETLSSTLDTLRAAVAQPLDKQLENNAKIFLLRGDAEMLRFRLGQHPWNHIQAQKSAKTLLKNAETHYRGGWELARRANMVEESRVGKFKETVAAALGGSAESAALLKAEAERIMSDAQEFVEDSFVDRSDMQRLLS